jgi:ataxia telangiectasia mutated family protein
MAWVRGFHLFFPIVLDWLLGQLPAYAHAQWQQGFLPTWSGDIPLFCLRCVYLLCFCELPGAMGVEGVFRRCCEEALAVFRAKADCLSTVIEVFMHDPLYKWSLSATKMKRLQRRESDDVLAKASASGFEEADGSGAAGGVPQENVNAQRVFFRFQEKLAGRDKAHGQLSVAGHVNMLITEATDPRNLARLYHGWQPWL